MSAVCRIGLLLLLVSSTPVIAVERGENLLDNPGFEEEGGWEMIGEPAEIDSAHAHTGQNALRCMAGSSGSPCGVLQSIRFDPPIHDPLRVGAWCRSQGLDLGGDGDLFLYVDVHYSDGSNPWGEWIRFDGGTRDWYHKTATITPRRAVRGIDILVLLSGTEGTAWFDDINVSLIPFRFEDLRVVPDLVGDGSLVVRGATTVPASWQVVLRGAEGVVAQAQDRLQPIRMTWIARSEDRTAAADYRVEIIATDDRIGETIREERRIEAGRSGNERPYAVWTETSMRRVLPYALPERIDPHPHASIALAGGEYESFQVVLLAAPEAGLDSVGVQVTDLVSPAGGGRIPATEIEWRQVGFVRLGRFLRHPDMPGAFPGWWPDPLLPVDSVDLMNGVAQPVWVTVHAPPGTPAGDYVGRLTFAPKGAVSTSVEVQVTVYGFDLPVRGHLRTAFALMDGFLERMYGRPLDPDMRRRYGDFMLQHRLNPSDAYRTSPPVIEDLLYYRNRGLNAHNLLHLASPRGSRTWVALSPLEVYTPEFKSSLIERLETSYGPLRQNDLLDDAFVYGFDERDEDYYPIIRDIFGMIKSRYPDIHTLTTAHVPQDPKVMDDLEIDWLCPLTSAYSFDDAEVCRQAGKEVWSYVCMGPRYPYANWLAGHPLIEARIIWWQAFHQRLDGFLYWGMNVWESAHNDRPIDPEGGPLLDWSITSRSPRGPVYGDGRLLYPGNDGPIGSIRLANIRDGLEDYEYLWHSADLTDDDTRAREQCLPVTEGLTRFTRNPRKLYEQRSAVARMIESR